MLLIVCFTSACRQGILPDLTHNFSKNSKKPFGTYVAYNLFRDRYNGYVPIIAKKDFATTWASVNGSRNFYMLIADKVLVNEANVNAMLSYVESGNQLFIASGYIGANLFDTLGIKVNYLSFESIFSTQQNNWVMKPTALKMKNTDLFGNEKYGFFYYPLEDYFGKTDSIGATVLGTTEKGNPDYISLPYGRGRFFFHLHPEAFSNYFLLTKNNKAYLEHALSYTGSDRSHIYWDDGYRLGKPPGSGSNGFSMFQVFKNNPMLYTALWLAMILMLLYIAFASKRRQRPMSVRLPNTNSSVSFVETIGRLYLQKKDNRNIAHKMITYFMEQVRTQYYLNTSHINTEFFSSLSRKSGIGEAEVKKLFHYISELQERYDIGDAELLELNNTMQQYFKK